MKIKDYLEDYYTTPNIPAKNLSNMIASTVETFKTSLKDGVITPYGLIKIYMDKLKDINQCFKTCVLKNKTSKSGIYVSQYKGYSIATAMKEYYNFSMSPQNQRMNYSFERLHGLLLVETSLLIKTFGIVYDFQIKFAIMRLLCYHFRFCRQDVYDDSWSAGIFRYGQDDIETAYNMVLDTEVSELPQIDKELIVNILNKKRERITPKSINKPYCKEDLTILYDESTSQKDKKAIIAAHYNVSPSTAQRWMKYYGLLKESNNKKHDEKIAKERKEQEMEEKNKKLM